MPDSPSPEFDETPKNFEQGMQLLENIVDRMESSDLPLEEILSHYEIGMKLVKSCGDQLKAAEARIALLTKDPQNNLVEKDWSEDSVESDAPVHGTKKMTKKKSASDSQSDEVSLF